MKGILHSTISARHVAKSYTVKKRGELMTKDEAIHHGKWIRRWTDPNKTAGIMIFLEQQCSECGCKFKDKPRDYKVCPNCGARMGE